MNYVKFYERFAGSCRTKHIEREDLGIKSEAKRILNHLLGRKFKGKWKTNRRAYFLPEASGLPQEFIRLDPWEMEYLFMIAATAKRGILETGRFNGGSVFVMACANQDVPITSIDINPQDDVRLKNYFLQHDVGKNVHLIVGDSQTCMYPEVGELDLLFIDGDHSYEGCSKDLVNWYHRVLSGGHIILHDCYFDKPVQRAVTDFVSAHDVRIVRSPYIPATHWHQPTGSLVHFVKS